MLGKCVACDCVLVNKQGVWDQILAYSKGHRGSQVYGVILRMSGKTLYELPSAFPTYLWPVFLEAKKKKKSTLFLQICVWFTNANSSGKS